MPSRDRPYPLRVLPPEHRRLTDPVTGLELTFCTTGPNRDRVLYFHQRAWLADDSLLLFESFRPEPVLMGYLPATGEQVEIGAGLWGTVAAKEGNRLFTARGQELVEMTVEVEPGPPSRVTVRERPLATLPAGAVLQTLLQENADGTLLGFGVRWERQNRRGVVIVNTMSGEWQEVGEIDFASSHVLFSRTSPHLMSFNGKPGRLWLVDCREGKPWRLYEEAPGEYATHENWWNDDRLLFLSGRVDVEGAVKVVDSRTGTVRIIGQGAWEPYPPPGGDDTMNRWYWWEASGSEDGRWVAADNWYGDVVVWDARTLHFHRLTLGHRHYRGAVQEQPSVGWDRSSRRLTFTSQMIGGAHPCLITLPEGRWWDDPVAYPPASPH